MPSMSDELVRWLGEQLDEDERIARRVESSWRQIGETGVIVASDGDRAEECANGNWAGIAEHIVEHDPARVLREIEAKRGVLRQHEAVRGQVRNPVSAENRRAARIAQGELEDVVRLLAVPYSDRPGYRQEWKP
jgi:hypothetical protein